MAAEWFSIIEFEKAWVIDLRLPDQIDYTYFDQINRDLLKAVEAADAAAWVIDLAHMRFVSSAVLGLMVNIRQRVRARGGTLTLCCVSGELHSVLRTSALDRLFPVKKTRADAVR